MRWVFFGLGVVLGSIVGIAQEHISARLFLRPAENLLQVQPVGGYWVRGLVLQAVAMLPQAELRLSDFPVGYGEEATVHLRRARSVVDAQTQWWRGVRPARDGQPEQLEPMQGITQYVFHGHILGEPGSQVTLSVVGGELYGFIRRRNGRLWEFVPSGQRWGNEREHVLGELTTQSQLSQWLCAIEQMSDYWEQLRMIKEPTQPIPHFTTLRQARVAVEATSSLYVRLNRDYDRVAAYIASLFAMVARIYEDELNVTFLLPWILIWMEPPDGEEDPYQNDNDIGALLGEVSAYWNQHRRSVERDLVHVMTAPGGTMVGGIARLNTLCSPGSAYSVSGIRGTYAYPTLGYTWDVHVVAHEIGHVFGAPHTHACYWSPPLDTCVTQDGHPYPTPDACYRSPIIPRPSWDGGSIMSYCHLVQPSVALTFRQRVAVVLRNSRAEACLAQPSTPLLLLQHPVGKQSFRGGSQLEIRWTSAQVQNVTLEYSTDSMRTWERIATGIAATQRSYRWELPRANIPVVWLRIYNTADPAVGDTTLASFAIQIPELRLSRPVGGERYGQREQVNIEWSATLVSVVRLLFSSNGGASWDTLVPATSGRSYVWTVPMVQTDRAVIRIEDTADPTVADQSPFFAIGIPQLSLLVPNGGERWAAGTKQWIRWQSDFVSRIRIEYSTDGGQSWRTIRATQDATVMQYEWTVPNTPTEQALVRLRNLANMDQSVQSAAPFVIEPPISVEFFPVQSTVRIQPFSDQGNGLWLRVQLPEPLFQVQLRLMTLLGQVVQELRWEQVSEGEHLVRVPLPAGLADGVYLLYLTSAQGRWGIPVRLVR